MQDRQGGRRPYRGRRPSAARVRFLELLDSGMRPLEASREVGVNERTGRDWARESSRARTAATPSTVCWSGKRLAGRSRRAKSG